MVFRFIFRYLASNEHLVNKLADSYPVRKAARFVVSFFTRTKSVVENEVASGKLKDFKMKDLASKLENHLKQIKEDLEKNAKK